ncbi:hypothetical protein OROMI_013937 [Orobanche minor]
MSNEEEISIPSVEDAYKFCNFELNPDGSLTRLTPFPIPIVPAVPEIDPDKPIADITLSRDIPLNPKNKTYIRLFRPRNIPPETKLPIIFHFHGAGFMWLGPDAIIYAELSNRTAAHTPAVIAAVGYRLTPEHRLPAAYDDAVEAINWAKTQALAAGGDGDGVCDPWMEELVDFSRVFLMGLGSGGNIVYHAALRAVDLDLEPLKIVGLIINQPFFGGLQRTESEITYANDVNMPLHVADLLWSLALPEGADRGHEYCDPSNVGSHGYKIVRLPTTVVRTYEGSILVDRQQEFAHMLAARGVHVMAQFMEGGYQAMDIVDPISAQTLYDDIRDFVSSVARVYEVMFAPSFFFSSFFLFIVRGGSSLSWVPREARPLP